MHALPANSQHLVASANGSRGLLPTPTYSTYSWSTLNRCSMRSVVRAGAGESFITSQCLPTFESFNATVYNLLDSVQYSGTCRAGRGILPLHQQGRVTVPKGA